MQAGEQVRRCAFCPHLHLHPLPARQRQDADAHRGRVLALLASFVRLADVSCLLELRGSDCWAGSSCCCQAEALGEAFLDSFEWEPGALSLQEKIHEVRKYSSSSSSGSTLGLLAWHADPSPRLPQQCSWTALLLPVLLSYLLDSPAQLLGVQQLSTAKMTNLDRQGRCQMATCVRLSDLEELAEDERSAVPAMCGTGRLCFRVSLLFCGSVLSGLCISC